MASRGGFSSVIVIPEVVARISLCGHLGRCDGGDRAAYDAQVVQRFDGRKAQLRACSRLLTRGFSEQLDENRGFCMIRLGEGVFKQRTRVSDGGPLDLLGSVYMAERDVVEAVEDPCIDVVEASDVDLESLRMGEADPEVTNWCATHTLRMRGRSRHPQALLRARGV